MSLSLLCPAGDAVVFPFPCPKGCGRYTSQPEVVCCALCVLPTGEQGHTAWCDAVQTTATLTDHALAALVLTLEVSV